MTLMKASGRKSKIIGPEEENFRRQILERIEAAIKRCPHGSKTEIAEECGVTRNTISNWKKNKGSPSAWTVLKIAEVTEHRPSYIAFGEFPKTIIETANLPENAPGLAQIAISQNESILRNLARCVTLCKKLGFKDAELHGIHSEVGDLMSRQQAVLQKLQRHLSQALEALHGTQPKDDAKNGDV
jgi:transcriptional regulator with XRE-family HTH domain